jgi:cyclase
MLFGACLWTSLASAAWPQGVPAAPPPLPSADMAALRKQELDILVVKPGLYMVTGAGGNVSVRVTPDGIILVDTKNAGGTNYDRLIAIIRSVSAQPIKIVIDTHHHGDHTGNNAQFIAAGATVIGRSNMAARMAAPGPDGKPPPAAPNSPYSGDRSEVTLGGAVARIYHLGDGHTDTDSVVFFPDLKTVATGDLYVSVTPMVDYRGGGTLLGTQKAIVGLLKLDFDTVIAGHGLQPVPRSAIEKYKVDLDNLIARAEALIRQQVPKDELMARIKADDLSWNLGTPQWSGPQAASSIYDELSAAVH